MYKNETTLDEVMGNKLKPILEDIIEKFKPEARQFYERVFQFSDRLTNVSDKIKNFPKGPERKEGKSFMSGNQTVSISL